MDQLPQENDIIKVFLEQLLEEAGITPVPELKESMVSDLEDRLNTHFMQGIAEQLSPQDFEKFMETSGSNPEAGQQFLATKINAAEFYAKSLASFREMFLNS